MILKRCGRLLLCLLFALTASAGEPEALTRAAPGALVFQGKQPPTAGPLYLQVVYPDRGHGRLSVQVKDSAGKWTETDKHTRAALTDSGETVTSLHRWSGTAANPPEVRVSVPVNSVTLQAEPFADAHFQYLLAENWQRPYDGPSVKGVPNDTLRGRVMAGYQGWFRTPNDATGRGWVHWGDMERGLFSTDMWPDTSAYPPEALERAAGVRTRSGKPALLFSSEWPEVARLHFRWMREHEIDGAFLQRFVGGGTNGPAGRPEWVLGSVREAAHREGRLWAVEYDVSGAPDARLLEIIRDDWRWLVDRFGLRQDTAYAHEGGKPVVFVWGMPVPGRNITPETANAVVEFLKNDPVYGGNYVIGGLPNSWRKLEPAWQEHIKKYDGVLAWQSQRYAEDLADFRALHLDYFPHVWPGFSWANLKHLPTGSTEAYTPRAGGKFYEDLLTRAAKAGTDRLFVGMLDEYDEGTAILPMSDDPPPTPQRPGVNVKFFNGPIQAEGPHQSALLPQIDLALNGSPPAKGIDGTRFNVRFDGTLLPPATGSYTFTLEGAPGDHARLWIGPAQLKVDDFAKAPPDHLAVTLTAGEKAPLRLEYAHTGAPGALRLWWEAPGHPRELVPASAYVDAWGRFLTSEGQPPDRWLQLTKTWKALLH